MGERISSVPGQGHEEKRPSLLDVDSLLDVNFSLRARCGVEIRALPRHRDRRSQKARARERERDFIRKQCPGRSAPRPGVLCAAR